MVRLRAREGTLSRKSTVCTEVNFTEFCFVLFGRNSKFLFWALQLVTCQSGQHLPTYSELCIAQLCASCACGLLNIWNSLHSSVLEGLGVHFKHRVLCQRIYCASSMQSCCLTQVLHAAILHLRRVERLGPIDRIRGSLQFSKLWVVHPISILTCK